MAVLFIAAALGGMIVPSALFTIAGLLLLPGYPGNSTRVAVFVGFTVEKSTRVLTSSWLAVLGYRAIEAGIRALAYRTGLPAGALYPRGPGTTVRINRSSE